MLRGLVLICFCCSTIFSSLTLGAKTPVEAILEIVKQRNTIALSQFKKRYGTLDFVDHKGQTPLCYTIYQNDHTGFAMLAKFGANREHACMRQMPEKYKQDFINAYKTKKDGIKNKKGSAFEIDVTEWVSTLAGAGAIALLLSDGGDSSKSKKQNTEENSGTIEFPYITPVPPQDDNEEDKPIEGEPYALTPSYFETDEYKSGEFLGQINAAGAYAKIYNATKDSTGEINLNEHTIKNVNVAVVDIGVYNHKDLEGKLTTGYNYAYGPCRNSSSKNCWFLKTEESLIGDITGYAFRDGEGKESSIVYLESEEGFAKFASQYPKDYEWSENKNLYTPVGDGNANSHGTHVSGIIAANKNSSGMHGVAQNATIIPIRYDLLSGLTNPIKTAVGAGAKVINMSLGSNSVIGWNAKTAVDNKTNWLKGMEDRYALEGFKHLAEKKSTILVIAAGNEAQDEPTAESGAGLAIDGLDDVMIVVVATKSSDPTKLASYSNKCGSASGYCLAAPGGDSDGAINSTIGTEGYGKMAGTSMAAPVVSGSAAVLMGAYPNLSASDVVSILFETASDLGDKSTFGHGLLDLEAAVTKPLGKVQFATTNKVTGAREFVEGTVFRIPSSLKKQIMKKLPEGIAVLDKYDRSFMINTKNFVKGATHDPEVFKNKLHRFITRNPSQRIETTPNMSFGFTKAATSDSKLGIGAMDVMFKLNKQDVRFYYVEDSMFGQTDSFESVMQNPFTNMNNAYGITDTYHLNNKMRIKTGFMFGENGLYKTNLEKENDFNNKMYAFETGVEYEPIKGMNVGFVGGTMHEKDAVLGMHGDGVFDMKSGKTYYMGITASIEPTERLKLRGTWFYGLTEGRTQNAFLSTTDLYSDGFSLDARYNLNTKDFMGVQLVSPLRIRKGHAMFDLPMGRDYYTDTVYREKFKASLKPDAREYDISIYYAKELKPKMHLKAQTGIRLNPDHQKDAKPDYQTLMGLDWLW